MSSSHSSPMPRSAGLSAFLHLLIFGSVFFYAWWSQRVDNTPPPAFELVAGPGDNYMATAAPTTIEAEPSVTVDIPEPEPRPIPPPPRPEPKPPPPAPEPRVVPPKPAPVVIEKAPEPPPVKIEPARERVSFAEFAQTHGAPEPQKTRAPAPIRPTKINVNQVMESTAVVTTGAGGTAMTSNELNMSKRYVAMIINRIRQALEQAGINDLREAGVRFSVSTQGAISDASITRSSGSAEFDRAVLAAFRSIRPIGIPPTGRAEIFTTVIRLTEG
jgi:TonB family protein